MNHYPHHIGDFNSATRHLTFVERALYRELLDLYYDTERPLIADATKLARRVLAHTDEQREALQAVLQEFFVQEDDGWHNARCDREIAAYHERIEQQSRAGRASAAKRAQRMPGDGDGGGTVGAGARKASNKQATDVARPFNDRSTNQNQNHNQLIPPNPPAGGADAVDAAPGRAGGRVGQAGQGGAVASAAAMATATALFAYFPDQRRTRIADVARKIEELQGIGEVTAEQLLRAAAQQADRLGKEEGKACPSVLRWLRDSRWLDAMADAGQAGSIPDNWRDTRSGIEAMGARFGLGPWDQDKDKLFARYERRVVEAYEASLGQGVPA